MSYYELTNSDYKKLLEFYDQKIPKSKRLLKKNAENILAEKLCRCIKKISPGGEESRSIGICTKTILNRKGIKRSRFTCKTKKTISGLRKTKKNLTIKSKK